MTHRDHAWHSPGVAPLVVELSRRFRLIRCDERGCRPVRLGRPRPRLEDWIRDVEAVVDAAALERLPLFGMSQGVAVAITYAARHPERSASWCSAAAT